ncbi:ion transporter [Fructilactobacillus lindneri]|uniref:Potassium ion channel protein n=2 Tax=Fructilactobacillus lindneri TaxID=53444 RepID=A0A0R2JSG0_9LACO|nr:ion channel [Fructilactobacillus lindneri]ANZ57416.1 ion transporter [Fructilactobacillus lindneri]ANZ58683.1 ion transporter [Fructilactobacillus lindneri]KRN80027.1 potassium ion channel protein [Fructilactobacillus lindneri DSM 20690 = JCM 11027]POG97901.1 ion transporter [Fructilactobacillus lindneri]POG99233.1 ion transporter [Fructilactobacillus lindneri]
MKKLNNKYLKSVYNPIIIILAIVSITMAILDLNNIINLTKYPYYEIDISIWIIFIFDYFGGLILAQNKKLFIKHHIFDLLAIIPVNSFFMIFKTFRFTRVFRLAKLTKLSRLLRLVGVTGKLKDRVTKFLKTNGFIYLAIICGIILIISAGIYSLSENISFSKALWWAMATTTTVGYGDISHTTTIGKLVAVVLMLVGIGFVGMLTSTITSFFAHENQKVESVPDEIRKYKSLLDDGIITKTEFEAKKKQLLKLK